MFRQHIPGSVSSTPKISNASTLEEVLAIDWVARWATKPNFQKWARDKRSLMAFLNIEGVPDGLSWHVIGFADFDLPLPEAVYPKKEESKTTYTGGIQIKQDGQFWMIWRPSEDGRAMLGYCGDSDTWRYGMAQRYPSEQMCKEVVSNRLIPLYLSKRSEHD